jgi:hypothetical protein
MSVQQYEGGVIWAGREGIYTYDGTTGLTPENFVEDRLGSYYKKLVRDVRPDDAPHVVDAGARSLQAAHRVDQQRLRAAQGLDRVPLHAHDHQHLPAHASGHVRDEPGHPRRDQMPARYR